MGRGEILVLKPLNMKNLLSMQETWVQALDWEYTPEKGLATHSGFLAWKIPWTEKPGGLQSMRPQRVGKTQLSYFHLFISISEENDFRIQK